MESPEKNLPKALPLSIFLIAVIYLGIVFVSMRLNPIALLESKNVVVLADVFNSPILQNTIVLGAFVSMFGINIAASFHTPRLLEAMAKDGQFSIAKDGVVEPNIYAIVAMIFGYILFPIIAFALRGKKN